MSEEATQTPGSPDVGGRTAVLVHLVGSRGGAVDRLPGERAVIGTAPDATVHFVAEHEPRVAHHHAELIPRFDDSGTLADLEVRAIEGQQLRVNDLPVEQQRLRPDDILQLGVNGPVLRLRIHEGELSPYKTPLEALADCLANARYCSDNPLGRARAFAAAVPAEMVQLSPAMRWGMGLMILLVVGSLTALGYHTYTLEQRLEAKSEELSSISVRLEETRSQQIDPETLDSLRETLSGTLDRIDQLETQLGATAQVIADAVGSVVFIQGSYGFVEPGSGRRLRAALDESGNPITTTGGEVRVRLGGDGPTVKRSYSGTAFIATEDGLLLTNRHVAQPWDFDRRARELAERGIEARPLRLVAYLPGHAEPFEAELAAASEEADLALLRAPGIGGRRAPLPLAQATPPVGEEVILLGYPAGLKAMIVRADPALREQLSKGEDMDFWSVTRQLAAGNGIQPLATSGIIGQVSGNRIAYDAGTTIGGSGGPLLDHEGRVVAINQAVVRDFESSNLGVPVEFARRLLAQARD